MRSVKKYLSIALIIIVMASTYYIYVNKEEILTIYYSHIIDSKHDKAIQICKNIFTSSLTNSPEIAIKQNVQCRNRLSEVLNYYNGYNENLFLYSFITESGINFDIAMNYAYEAILYEKLGNTKEYNRNMNKALKIFESSCAEYQMTEEKIRNFITSMKKNYASKQ